MRGAIGAAPFRTNLDMCSRHAQCLVMSAFM
jgi:hypothetical protein